MDDKVQVLITGKSDELQAAFADAQSQVKAANDAIASSTTAAMSETSAAVAEASEAVHGHAQSMIHGFESITESIEGFHAKIGVFGEFATALSELVLVGFGLEKLADVFIKLGEQGEHLDHLSQATGIAATKLSEFGVSAQLSGYDADTGERGYIKLARAITEAGDASTPAARAFAALGISTEELKNLSPDEVLRRVADAFQRSEDSAQKSAIAHQLFGNKVEFWVSMLNKGSEGLDEMAAEGKKLGAVLSQEDVGALDSMAEGWNKAKVAAKGFFQEVTLGYVYLYRELTQNNAQQAYDPNNVPKAQPAGDQKQKLDFDPNKGKKDSELKQFQEDLDAELQAQHKFGDAATREELAYWQARLAIGHLNADDYVAIQQKIYTLTGEIQRKGVEDSKKAEEEKKRAQQEAVRDVVSVLNEQRDAAKKGSADRIAIDEEELAYVKSIAPQRLDIISRIERQITEDKRAQAEQRKQIDQIEEQGREQTALHGLNMQEEMLRSELQQHQITKDQELEAERAIEDRRYQIQKDYLTKKLALESDDIVAQKKTNLELEKLEQQHEEKMLQLNLQEQHKVADGFRQTMQSLQQTWAQGLASMLERGFSWRGLITGLFQSIENAFLQMLANLLTEWITNQIESLVIGKTTGVSQIAANAAVAASGAYAATAMIPYVGPFLAPGAAATAYSGALSYEALVSAAGGYDIPANMNPVAQLHASEMVLPAHIAEPLRAMLAGGAGSNGARSFHYHDHTGRAPSDNQDQALKALRMAARKFQL